MLKDFGRKVSDVYKKSKINFEDSIIVFIFGVTKQENIMKAVKSIKNQISMLNKIADVYKKQAKKTGSGYDLQRFLDLKEQIRVLEKSVDDITEIMYRLPI